MLRPATEADLDAIRRWRNHPEVQAVSLNREEITPEMHAAWWAAVQADDSRLVLIYERGSTPCGVVTFFDIVDADGERSAMWGYYLDNEGLTERGELMPAWMKIQREAVKYADEELRLDVLEGEVLDHNEGVRRMNQRNGFVEVNGEEREIGGETVTVHRVRRERPASS
jgi:RimJ/RimL family protein N-acetyltransferase